MAKFVSMLEFIKEVIADEAKMNKFREIVADLKELISDINDVKDLFDKN